MLKELNQTNTHTKGINDTVSSRISRAAGKVAPLLIMLVTLAASGKPSAPVGLLVNGASDPLAIDRDTTRFTWMSKDSERGERQTAYQILVYSSACTKGGDVSTIQRFNDS